jgi:hypothetical protein
MSVEYAISCDFCGALGDASAESAAAARRALRDERSWKVNLPGGQDKCEHCQQQGIVAVQARSAVAGDAR